MGAETSILDDCDLDEPIEDVSLCPWVIRHGQLSDETTITIFSDQNSDRQKSEIFKRNIKNLKSLRHPSILRFLASGEKSGHNYVVTERVVPLGQVLGSLDATEICAGLFSVLEGLAFLHDKAGISHNNVCIESIFVTDTGQWKLGGLGYGCKFSQATSQYLSSFQTSRNQKVIAPEEKRGSLETSSEWGYTRDVYSFGVLAESLLEHMDDLGDMTKTFELRISDECLNQDPKARPKLETLLNDRLFRNDFLSISRFLQSITLKSEEDKADFFEDVIDRLLQIPEETVGKCLTRLLLCRFVLLDDTAQQSLVPHILVPCRDSKRPVCKSSSGEITPLFCTPVYITYVIPELHKIFHCHDYHIRMVLLTYFSQYVDLFDKDTLEQVILPQVLIGIRDTSEDLAAQSLRCLADLVPLLGREIVIGGKSKTYFRKGMPNFSRQHIHQSNGEAKFHNVTGAMEKVPVLLKDLAKLSSQNKEKEDDLDQKKIDREQRLQEAKLKREQRKKERQMKLSKALPQQETPSSPDHSTIKHVHFADQMSEGDVDPQPVINISDDSVSPAPYNNEDNNDSEEMIEDEEIFADDKDDWSDWEDNTIKTQNNTDDNLSISESVHSDNSTLFKDTVAVISIDKTESIHSSLDQTLGDNESPGDLSTDRWTSDWSSPTNHLQSVDNTDSQDYMSKTSTSEKSFSQTSKNKNSKALSLISKNNKQKEAKKKQSLGSEYDIKNLELTVSKEKTEEFDFFADMKPVIKSPKPSVMQTATVSKENTPDKSVSTHVSGTTAPSDVSSKPAISMSYVDTGGDADGWGDDLNWDEDGGF